MTRCFAYLRVSGMGQVDGDGFTRQLDACEKYAAANALEIAEVFREEGVSGTMELDGRKALPELIAALEENGVKTVLIEKLDRLARDLMVQETILSDMRKSGFTVISAMEPDLCSSDPSRVLMRQIFGAIAQYDKTMIVLKTRAARERIRARTGRCEGRKGFGFREGEPEILERMVRERRAGQTLRQIAAGLNADGITSRMDKEWKVGSVAKILGR